LYCAGIIASDINDVYVKKMGTINLRILKRINLLIIALLFLSFSGCQENGTVDQIYSSGINHAIRGEFEKAKKEFEKALKVDQSHKPSKESREVIEDVLVRKLKNKAGIYFFKAISNSNEGRLDIAISYFSMAIKQNPEFIYAYFERGLVNGHKGDYDRAIADFTKTIELNPEDAAAFNNRGLAYAKGKDHYDLAFKDFNKAIELNPKFAEAYDNRGIVYRIKFNDKENACADWKRACELNRCYSFELAKQNGYCE
jgi:tetratricopeptide (TPR) repeat protein